MQDKTQLKEYARRDNLRAIRKKQVISYRYIHKFINDLAKATKDKHYVGVYGIPRGGLFFAMLYSYKTKIPMLQAPCKNCLVIDDDSGLGTSIAPYIRRGYDTAVMFSRKSCKEKATFVYDYYDNYDKDVYLVFPWGE